MTFSFKSEKLPSFRKIANSGLCNTASERVIQLWSSVISTSNLRQQKLSHYFLIISFFYIKKSNLSTFTILFSIWDSCLTPLLVLIAALFSPLGRLKFGVSFDLESYDHGSHLIHLNVKITSTISPVSYYPASAWMFPLFEKVLLPKITFSFWKVFMRKKKNSSWWSPLNHMLFCNLQSYCLWVWPPDFLSQMGQ